MFYKQVFSGDEMVAICGANAMPGTAEFNAAWTSAAEECADGVAIPKLVDNYMAQPVINDSGAVPPNCDRILNIARLYEVMPTDHLAELDAKRSARASYLSLLEQKSQSGDRNATLLIALSLLDFSHVRRDGLGRSTVEPLEIKKYSMRAAEQGQADALFAFLMNAENKYNLSYEQQWDSDNSFMRYDMLNWAQAGLASANYLPALVWFSRYQLDRAKFTESDTGSTLSYSERMGEVRNRVSEARETIARARRLDDGRYAAKLDQIEASLPSGEDHSGEAFAAAIVLLAGILLTSTPDQQDVDDGYQENLRQQNRDLCRSYYIDAIYGVASGAAIGYYAANC